MKGLEACPAGKRRGIDVGRMAGEIRRLAIAFAKKAAPDLDEEDLAQSVALTILRRNGMRSAYDPRKASFGKYVTLVAKNVVGHQRGKRSHGAEVATEDGALEVLHEREHSEREETTSLPALVEQLGETAQEARKRLRRAAGPREEGYCDGVYTSLTRVVGLLERVEAAPELPRKAPRSRVRGAEASSCTPEVEQARARLQATLQEAFRRWQRAERARDKLRERAQAPQRTVLRLLRDPVWASRSNRALAERSGVSHPTVARLRQLESQVENDVTVRVGRDGRARPAPRRAAG